MKILRKISTLFYAYMILKLESYQVCYIIGFDKWFYVFFSILILESTIAYFLFKYNEDHAFDIDIKFPEPIEMSDFDFEIMTESMQKFIDDNQITPNNNNEKPI